MTNQNGLTLVELLLALMVASVVSVAGISLARQTLEANTHARDLISAVDELAVAHSLIEADTGSVAGNDMTLTPGGFSFRRIADSFASSKAAPPIQITYAVENGALVRRTSNGNTRSLVAATGFAATVLGKSGWTDKWPQQNKHDSLPRAVSLTLTTPRWGQMTMTFPIHLAIGPQ